MSILFRENLIVAIGLVVPSINSLKLKAGKKIYACYAYASKQLTPLPYISKNILICIIGSSTFHKRILKQITDIITKDHEYTK